MVIISGVKAWLICLKYFMILHCTISYQDHVTQPDLDLWEIYIDENVLMLVEFPFVLYFHDICWVSGNSGMFGLTAC